MENLSIRKLSKVNNVPLWQIARFLGVAEPTFTRWMRTPLPADKEARIIAAIKELAGENFLMVVEQQTRADKWRSMTDEEIARAIIEINSDDVLNQFCKDSDCGGDDCVVDTENCFNCCLKWLREEK